LSKRKEKKQKLDFIFLGSVWTVFPTNQVGMISVGVAE
jgi:hypothetical protein